MVAPINKKKAPSRIKARMSGRIRKASAAVNSAFKGAVSGSAKAAPAKKKAPGGGRTKFAGGAKPTTGATRRPKKKANVEADRKLPKPPPYERKKRGMESKGITPIKKQAKKAVSSAKKTVKAAAKTVKAAVRKAAPVKKKLKLRRPLSQRARDSQLNQGRVRK